MAAFKHVAGMYCPIMYGGVLIIIIIIINSLMMQPIDVNIGSVRIESIDTSIESIKHFLRIFFKFQVSNLKFIGLMNEKSH